MGNILLKASSAREVRRFVGGLPSAGEKLSRKSYKAKIKHKSPTFASYHLLEFLAKKSFFRKASNFRYCTFLKLLFRFSEDQRCGGKTPIHRALGGEISLWDSDSVRIRPRLEWKEAYRNPLFIGFFLNRILGMHCFFFFPYMFELVAGFCGFFPPSEKGDVEPSGCCKDATHEPTP